MNDEVGIGICAAESVTAYQAASPGFRRVGSMSALQTVLNEDGLDGSAIITESGALAPHLRKSAAGR
jgi:hypothetical protein